MLPKERYSREEMDVAFSYVQDSEHWKNPLTALIPNEMLDVVEQAVIYFTGSVVFVTPLDEHCSMVEAAGYFLTIGA